MKKFDKRIRSFTAFYDKETAREEEGKSYYHGTRPYIYTLAEQNLLPL